jgi:hypothetical protein
VDIDARPKVKGKRTQVVEVDDEGILEITGGLPDDPERGPMDLATSQRQMMKQDDWESISVNHRDVNSYSLNAWSS